MKWNPPFKKKEIPTSSKSTRATERRLQIPLENYTQDQGNPYRILTRCELHSYHVILGIHISDIWLYLPEGLLQYNDDINMRKLLQQFTLDVLITT
ncbi:hypothetical protein JTB14_036150 [Gonioctena quinquepunctata]|nr:hypothetical protein JTB14_036150 [Gonioctena quinquepunctata]